MSEDIKRPTHRISFSEKIQDENGQEKLGRPVEVGAVFGREGKEGGIIRWNISPEKLGDGVYFQLENNRDRQQTQDAGKGFDQVDERAAEKSAELER